MSGAQRTITWARARELVRIANDARAFGSGTDACREHVVRGLGRLLDTRFIAFYVDPCYRIDGHGPIGALVSDGNVSQTILGFIKLISRLGRAHHPMMAAMISRWRELAVDDVVTVRRRDVVDDEAWYASAFARTALAAGYDDCILSARKIAPAVVCGFGMLRGRDDPPFTEEDRDLVQLMSLEFDRLTTPAMTETKTPVELAPRVRETLEALLAGAQDKEIAEQLGISHHTVRQYVKVLYRTFEVTSRSQLIARWHTRDVSTPTKSMVVQSGESKRRGA